MNTYPVCIREDLAEDYNIPAVYQGETVYLSEEDLRGATGRDSDREGFILVRLKDGRGEYQVYSIDLDYPETEQATA